MEDTIMYHSLDANLAARFGANEALILDYFWYETDNRFSPTIRAWIRT